MALASCTMLDQVANNAASIANLLNCEYALKNVSNVSVAGVNLKNVTNGEVTAADAVSLLSAITSKQVPLSMDVNIDVKNPTEKSALLTTMEWALDIAETSNFATGVTSKNTTITPKTTTTVPLGLNADLYSIFSKDGINSLKSFAGSFSSQGTSKQLGLRVRPTISVSGQSIKSPAYFDIIKKG